VSSENMTPEEVNDLLHKLMTESIKVLASFERKVCGVTASLVGLVEVFADGRVRIGSGIPSEPLIVFRLSVPSICTYADSRVLKGLPGKAEFFNAHFVALLTFRFEDGSVLSLFEIPDPE
jgi:hypothetical protein